MNKYQAKKGIRDSSEETACAKALGEEKAWLLEELQMIQGALSTRG